jgi:type VI secretion system secreted protein VgrG
VTYTYDSSKNSGVITVPTDPKSSGALCQTLYVAATSWKYTTNAVWPQVLDTVNPLTISKSASYSYGATVTCGQGDIYASFDSMPNPTSTLTAPNTPFTEHFLSDMSFSGPSPTYVQQDSGCWKPTIVTGTAAFTDATCAAPTGNSVDLPAVSGGTWGWSDGKNSGSYPIGQGYSGAREAGYATYTYTLTDGDAHDGYSVTSSSGTWTPVDMSGLDCNTKVIPGDPTVTPETCGQYGDTITGGTITVDVEPGLAYTITSADGSTTYPIIDGTASGLPAGDYLVNVSATDGYELSGASQWPLTVTVGPATGDCLPTLPALDSLATGSTATCTPDGAEGTITLKHVDGEQVDYTIDTAPAPAPVARALFRSFAVAASTATDLGSTTSSVSMPPGTYVVTASPVIAGQGMNDLGFPAGTVYTVNADGSITFTVTIGAPMVGACDLPTDAAFTASATLSPATCLAEDGTSGTIVLETTPGEVTYSITNTATGTTTDLGSSVGSIDEPAGSYVVTARVVHAADTLLGFNQPDGSQTFSIVVAAVVTTCDTALAFTGMDPTVPLALAGFLVFLGLGAMLMRRRFQGHMH